MSKLDRWVGRGGSQNTTRII